jgi:hypothetical protein
VTAKKKATRPKAVEARRAEEEPSLRPARGRRVGKRTHNKGYKSGLETKFGEETGLPYETDKIKYTIPAKVHTYTPDFKVTNNVYIETKGQWTLQDRKKALLVKEQHPEVIILYVLYRNQRLSKKSSTTYLDWATKNELPCCLFSDSGAWKDFINAYKEPNATA